MTFFNKIKKYAIYTIFFYPYHNIHMKCQIIKYNSQYIHINGTINTANLKQTTVLHVHVNFELGSTQSAN